MTDNDKKQKKPRRPLQRITIKKSARSSARDLWEDNPELDDDWFKRARPAAEILPKLIGQEATDRLLARSRGMRGPQKAPKKVPISIRLDSDVLDHYRAMGSGWQARMNADLRQNLNGLSDAPQSTFTPDPKPSKASPKARTPSKKSRPATRSPATSRKKPK